MSKKKSTHGGKRPGAGRKPKTDTPLKTYAVRLTRAQADFAYLHGKGEFGNGIRALIDAAIAHGDLGRAD